MKQNIIQTKKGIPLNQAFGAVLMLVLIGILIIIAIFLFVNLRDTFDATVTATPANESIAIFAAGTVNQTLAGPATCGFGTVSTSSVVVYNGTGDVLITPANYTVYSTGQIQNDSDDFSVYTWQVSYSYTWGGTQCDATETMITQFGTFPTLIGLVGTIIFLGLVIGVLVASFVFGGRRKSGGI